MTSAHRLLTITLFVLLLLTGAEQIWRVPVVSALERVGGRPLQSADVMDWKTIEAEKLSSDGRWFAYQFRAPLRGDSTLVFRATDSDKEYRVVLGEMAPQLSFSEDGRWAAFLTSPSKTDADRLRAQKQSVHGAVRLLDLTTGSAFDYPSVQSFAFSGESSGALALHRYPLAGTLAAGAKGSDLVVRDLSTGTNVTLGGVSEFAFDRQGRRLAWIVDAVDGTGNGLMVRDLRTGVVTALDGANATYENLSWTDKGDALAVLKGKKHVGYRDRLYSVVGVTGVSDSAIRTVVYDPTLDPAFPTGMTISPHRVAQWTDDRQGLLFGITAAAKEETDDEKSGNKGRDTPKVVLWHWNDARLQSEQQVEEERDKRLSYLATYRLAERKFLRLADDEVLDVWMPKRGRWTVGLDGRRYDLRRSLEGRDFHDLYMIDVVSGERMLVAKEVRRFFSMGPWPSPDGQRLLYFDRGHFQVFDAVSRQTTNITKGVPVSFTGTEGSTADGKGSIEQTEIPIRPEGWTADGKSVVLLDGWDVWQVPLEGAAVNLTGGYGRRFAVAFTIAGRPWEDPDIDKGIVLSVPRYYEMHGYWTKAGGVSRVTRREGADEADMQILVLDQALYRGADFLKAKRAETIVYSRQTRQEFPDFYVTNSTLKDARRITDGQYQLKPFAWSAGARLIEYTSDAPPRDETVSRAAADSERLQGALYLPANFEPGRRYPTIVFIYDRLSHLFNYFGDPTSQMLSIKSFFTSNGYAVLMPDMRYRINDPGMSAVWCVLPALKAAIATGIVDPERVGLHGHSWGGYQTAFLVTQTDAFKAAIAGAPPTDLVSFYNLIRRSSGRAQSRAFETGQLRFSSGYWDQWEGFVRNSPVVHAKKVKTPLVIMHNDQDRAVDFSQGIEYFNALRRLRKPVVLLQYVGEDHGPSTPGNQYDYLTRRHEFFDHHLKGSPAPDWWVNGVPRLEMETHLKGRRLQKSTTSPTALSGLPERR